MRKLFILTAHLLTTVAKLARPGGLGAVAAESIALKHQFAHNEARATPCSGPDPHGIGSAGGLHSHGVAQTPEQAGRDSKAVHVFALSSGLGETQIVFLVAI